MAVEIGFNAGHSALLMLLKDLRIWSFRPSALQVLGFGEIGFKGS